MVETRLSQTMMEDGMALFNDALDGMVGASPLETTKSQAPIPHPTYEAASIECGVAGASERFRVPASQETALAKLGGLRVIVTTTLQIAGQRRTAVRVAVPGVVLPDSTPDNIRFGILRAPGDILASRDAILGALGAPLTELQASMCDMMAAEQMPDVADHRQDGAVILNTGHSATIAATKNPANIHKQVHQRVERGFAPSVAHGGALNIGPKGKAREIEQHIVPLHSVSGILVSRYHQEPSTMQSGSLQPAEFVTGIILGAAASQDASKTSELARKDRLVRNADAMAG